jgi:type II secretory pathway component PulK
MTPPIRSGRERTRRPASLTHSRTHALTHSREGYALISVLWILVGVSALALAANLAGREAVASARNRGDLSAAAWRAEACLERARAAIHDALAAGRNDPPGATVWGRMDREVAESSALAGMDCAVEMRAAGAALDVNAADHGTLRRLFMVLGRSPADADSLADALADWRDEDDVPRPFGAEAAWYRSMRRATPRNGPLADARELPRVRGFDALPGIDTLLSTEPGRVPLTHGAPAVVAALPGLGPEAVARLAELRMRGERAADLAAFTQSLSPGARDEAGRRFSELVGAAVTEPEAWIVRARGGVGAPPAVSVVEVRLVRAGSRAAIVRRRTWTE